MAGSWGEWPPPSRPRRVEGGIKARSRRGQIGESWWSGRFVAILESLGMGPRLGRGRACARTGQVLDLGVAAGAVSAHVQGSRARPYRVSIGLARFGEADWARDDLLARLRALRAPTGPGTGSHEVERPGEARRFGLAVEDPPLAEQLDRFWASRGDLTAAQAPAAGAVAPDVLVRQLGPSLIGPRGCDLGALLAPAYRVMAASMRRDAEAGEA